MITVFGEIYLGAGGFFMKNQNFCKNAKKSTSKMPPNFDFLKRVGIMICKIGQNRF